MKHEIAAMNRQPGCRACAVGVDVVGDKVAALADVKPDELCAKHAHLGRV